MIKIALADDHLLFREGIRTILEKNPEFEVMIEANNGRELLNEIKKHSELPDVVLLDIRMPEMDGFQTVEKLQDAFPTVKTIVLSMHDEARHIVRMIEIGANGYLLKSARPEEVVNSILLVIENDYYFNNKINALMSKVIRSKDNLGIKVDLPVKLTSREYEVLELICKEFTTKEIGDQLFLSARTIEGHRKHLIEKVGVKNVAGLVVYALKYDLVTL